MSDATLAQIEADLSGVEQAMARLDEGTYDTCAVCGGPISDARLVDAPYVTRCATCAG